MWRFEWVEVLSSRVQQQEVYMVTMDEIKANQSTVVLELVRMDVSARRYLAMLQKAGATGEDVRFNHYRIDGRRTKAEVDSGSSTHQLLLAVLEYVAGLEVAELKQRGFTDEEIHRHTHYGL
jgi:hypothetical protein